MSNLEKFYITDLNMDDSSTTTFLNTTKKLLFGSVEFKKLLLYYNAVNGFDLFPIKYKYLALGIIGEQFKNKGKVSTFSVCEELLSYLYKNATSHLLIFKDERSHDAYHNSMIALRGYSGIEQINATHITMHIYNLINESRLNGVSKIDETVLNWITEHSDYINIDEFESDFRWNIWLGYRAIYHAHFPHTQNPL